MLKKTIFVIILSLLIISCGKKGCPKFNEENKCDPIFKKS